MSGGRVSAATALWENRGNNSSPQPRGRGGVGVGGRARTTTSPAPRGNVAGARKETVKVASDKRKVKKRKLPSEPMTMSPFRTLDEKADTRKFFRKMAIKILGDGLQLPKEAMEVVEHTIDAYSANLSPLPVNEKFLTQLIQDTHRFMQEQKKLDLLITLQKTVRCWLVRKKYRALSKKGERERIVQQNAKFSELIRTEKQFIESVDVLIKSYVIPLRHADVIQPHECAYLFSNIETVFIEHKRLCERLEFARRNYPFLDNIGKIFLDIKSLLNAISVYVGHFKTSLNELRRIGEENPKFLQFINNVEQETDTELATALMLPVNRISQYEFYLRELADTIPHGTPEREDCENAFAAMAQSSVLVQQSLVESGNVASILKIQRKLRTDKGPLSVMLPGRKLYGEYKFKKHYVCIFSDVVLIAKKESLMNKVKGKEKEGVHKFKAMLNIDKTELIADNKNFEIKCDNTSYKFIALNPEDKADFISKFNMIHEEINRIKVFNVSLIETIIQEESPNGIPRLIQILTKEILENHVTTPGIFRVAGSSTEIQALKVAFDAGEKNPPLKDKSPFSVCDALKLYFRSLPEPLLGYALYDPIVEMMKQQNLSDTERIAKIQDALLHWTPPSCLKVLRYLMAFLRDVAKHNEVNKMTTNNLAIVFGPTLLWAENNTLEAAMDMPYINGAIQLVIEHYVTMKLPV